MDRDSRIWSNAATWVTIACVALSGLVFVRRGLAAAAASRIAPGVAVTSGCEEESMFAVWRAVHGQPVYIVATRAPYAAAYFNWLFYDAYAAPVGAAVRLAGDAVIPLAGRLLTALGALLGATGLFWLLRRVLAGRTVLAAGLATFVYFGPLVGWWAHTLRPDVGALALETAGLACLLLQYRARPFTAVLLAGLFFYGAWSFKQTYGFGLGATLLFLACRRQWRPAMLLALISVLLWGATLFLLGPAYRASFQGTVVNSVYFLSVGLDTLRDMLLKALPLWLLAGAALPGLKITGADGKNPLATDARLLGVLGLLVTLPLAFAASCKLGAASYYYFTMQVMLALVAAGSFATRPAPRLALAGFGLAAGLQLLVLVGHAGRISLSDQTSELATTWAAWQQEAEPRFSHLTNLNLPWLNPGSPPFVLAYNYDMDRAAGRQFESGGIGGLITAGYFRTLLLPTDTGKTYDGGSLEQYVPGEKLDDLTVFHRQSTSSK